MCSLRRDAGRRRGDHGRRREHPIADPPDLDHDRIGGDRPDDAFDRCDHGRRGASRRRPGARRPAPHGHRMPPVAAELPTALRLAGERLADGALVGRLPAHDRLDRRPIDDRGLGAVRAGVQPIPCPLGVGDADRDRERVGGVVGRRDLREAEDDRHHAADLALLGPPVPGDAHLDLVRRHLADGDPGLGGREQDDAPRLADREGGLRVLREEQALHGHEVGVVGVEQLDDVRVDAPQALGQVEVRRW